MSRWLSPLGYNTNADHSPNPGSGACPSQPAATPPTATAELQNIAPHDANAQYRGALWPNYGEISVRPRQPCNQLTTGRPAGFVTDRLTDFGATAA